MKRSLRKWIEHIVDERLDARERQGREVIDEKWARVDEAFRRLPSLSEMYEELDLMGRQ